jgi:hypothetical protein
MTLLVALFVAVQVSPQCRAAALTGSFASVPGSAGAGNISYALTLRNTSAHRCFVTGIPSLRLLDRSGRPLPTHVRPAQPGALTAVRVDLAPGHSARATARFSPDVPGPGEPVAGRRCEPVAFRLRIGPSGGGTLRVPIRPPTSVCEHGTMTWTALTAVH